MARRIIFIFAAVCLTISCAPQPIATSSANISDPSSATVRIVCTWQRACDQGTYDVTVDSLGTVIAPHIILTHNHYGLSLGRHPSDTLAISDLAGRIWRGRALDAQLIVINADTSLIWLPEDLSTPTAPMIESATLPRLTVGQSLAVNYWDDTTQGIAQRAFKIVQVQESVVTLADPNRLINSGDSGGGVYFNSKLIGNIRSINVDRDRRPAGSFNIALLPSQVRAYTQ